MRILKIRTLDINQIVYFLFLFSVSNMFLVGSEILLVSTLVFVLFIKKTHVNNEFLLLMFFSLTYILFSVLSGITGVFSVFRVLIFPCAYYLGNNLHLGKQKGELKNVIMSIAICMATHMILNLIYNIYINGFNIFARNTFYDIFSKLISASTVQGSYAFVFCSIIGYILFSKEEAVKKIVLLAVYLVLLVYNFALGGRTFIFLSVLSIVISMCMYLKNEKGIIASVRFLIIVLIFLILYFVWSYSPFEINSNLENSYFFRRFFSESIYKQDFFSDSRFDIKLEYIENMFVYPFGGGLISKKVGFYAHELWLDIYDVAGVFPYLIMVAYSFFSANRFIKYSMDKKQNKEESMMIMSFLIVMTVAFFLEPIISGTPMVLAAYCFVHGRVVLNMNRLTVR